MGLFSRSKGGGGGSKVRLPAGFAQLLEQYGRWQFDPQGSGLQPPSMDGQRDGARALPARPADGDAFVSTVAAVALPAGGWTVYGGTRAVWNAGRERRAPRLPRNARRVDRLPPPAEIRADAPVRLRDAALSETRGQTEDRSRARERPRAPSQSSSRLSASFTLSAASPTLSFTVPLASSTLPSRRRSSLSVRSPAAFLTRPFAVSTRRHRPWLSPR